MDDLITAAAAILDMADPTKPGEIAAANELIDELIEVAGVSHDDFMAAMEARI